MSSTYNMAASKEISLTTQTLVRDSRTLEYYLNSTNLIRIEIEQYINDGEAVIKDYPKIYKDAFNHVIRFAKDNLALDLLRSEKAAEILRKVYNLVARTPRLHHKYYFEIRDEYDRAMVRIISMSV